MSLKSFIIAAIFPVISLAGEGLQPKPVKLDDPYGSKGVLQMQIRLLKQHIDKTKGADKRAAEADLENLEQVDSLDTQG